jgi:hypothetical protein
MAAIVRLNIGRLLEIRVVSEYRTAEDVDQVFGQIARVLAENLPPRPGEPVPLHVTVADWRKCPFMSAEAAARMGQGMAKNNPTLLRSATLATQGSPFAEMQFMRIMREGGHEGRRVFFEEEPLVQWLSEVLTVTELARLRQFLREA